MTGILLRFDIDEKNKDIAVRPHALLGDNGDINDLLVLGTEFLNTPKGQSMCDHMLEEIITYASDKAVNNRQ